MTPLSYNSQDGMALQMLGQAANAVSDPAKLTFTASSRLP
jgi:hypothetical protein